MQYELNNISRVYTQKLCMGCGTCRSACTKSAIRIVLNERDGLYMPMVDKNKCSDCGLCVDVCPGLSVDFNQLNFEVFGRQPEEAWLGNHIGLCIGHASDYEIRCNSSSGGVITALLIFALEHGIIDGAMVAKMKEDRPLEPEVFLARTSEEIISASGSKYCPVPTNMGLREILGSEGKFAVVGLPCHIQGLRKLEIMNKKLKDRIALRLGLMCSNNTTFLGTEYFLKKWGIEKEQVKEIRFRDRGWVMNYNTLAILKDGTKRILPRGGNRGGSLFQSILHKYTYHYDFVIPRCLTCCDHTAEFSDVSFGDPRLPELTRSEKAGKSLIVSRTQIGEDILRRAECIGSIYIGGKISVRKFFKGQSIAFKKKYGARVYALKAFGNLIPKYNVPTSKKGGQTELLNILPFVLSYFSSRRFVWGFLYPIALLRYYIRIFLLKAKHLKTKVFSLRRWEV